MNLYVEGQKKLGSILYFGLKILRGADSFAKVSGSDACSATCLAVFGETVIVTRW